MGEIFGFTLRLTEENKEEVTEKEEKEMRKNKIGAMFLASAIALAFIGSSYAMWSETIIMNGTVTTGTINIDWSLGNPYDDEAAGKDFSYVEANIVDPNHIQITIVGAYPCITYYVPFDIHNSGTIAVHLGPFVVDPASWATAGIIIITPNLYGYQLHPGASVNGILAFHFTNDDGFQQGSTYTFTVSVTGYQYNEYP